MAKPGPHKTPQKILKLRGSWLAKTRNDLPNNGAKPEFPADCLDEKLRPVWDDMVANLDRLGILDTIDKTMIAVYCQDYDDYWKAVKACDEWVVTAESGAVYQNPMVGIKNKAHDKLVKACSEFGMSPSARTGLATLGKNKETSEKSKFFKKGS